LDSKLQQLFADLDTDDLVNLQQRGRQARLLRWKHRFQRI
jgi:hypothetical protein